MVSYQHILRKEAKEIRGNLIQACKRIYPLVEEKSDNLNIDDISFHYVYQKNGYWYFTELGDEYSNPINEGMVIQFSGDRNSHFSIKFEALRVHNLFFQRLKFFTPLRYSLEDIITRKLEGSEYDARYVKCLLDLPSKIQNYFLERLRAKKEALDKLALLQDK